MAKSFNSIVADFTTLNQDSSGTAIGKTLLNIGIKKILNVFDWSFNKDFKIISTGTGIQYYDPPYNALKIDYVRTAYGNLWNTPQEVKDSGDWRLLNATTVSSSIHTYWNISN